MTSSTQILYSKSQDVLINECIFNMFGSYAISIMNEATNTDGFIFTNNDVTGNKKFLSANKIDRMPIISGNTFHNIINSDEYFIDFYHMVDEIILENNTFYHITSKSEAGGQIGAIFPHNNEALFTLTFDNCKFIDLNNLQQDNNANGGAICYEEDPMQNIIVQIKYCEFRNILCASGNGGAICLSTHNDVLISDCIFDDINAGQNGGAIYIDQTNSAPTASIQKIYNCSFNNCKSNSYAIEITKGNVEIDLCSISFTSNVESGAINIQPNDCVINNCNFTRTNAIGSLKIKQGTGISNPISILNCIFNECSGANRRCFNIEINQNTKLIFHNNIICNMKATDENGYFGLISYSSKNAETVIENMTFIDNECCSLYGGGTGLWIYNTEKISFYNCKFINNLALQYTSSARPNKDGDPPYYNGDGGAIQYGYTNSICSVDMEFINCTFKSNKAFMNGGAMALQTTKTIVIKSCVFEENIANYRQSNSLLLFNNYYNQKSDGKGGAIYLNPAFSHSSFTSNDYMKSVDIDNCTFISNKAHDGFAIYIEGDDPGTSFQIMKNTFINNYNIDTLSSKSSIISTEICRSNLPYKEIIQNNHFENEIDGNPLIVREIVCVDHSGNALLTSEFTESNDFSYSNSFSKSNKFSNSDEFTKTNQFSQSSNFSKTNDFSSSTKFSSSYGFSNSDYFSLTKGFSKSEFFSKSTLFSSSSDFTRSSYFSSSKDFNKSDRFTKSSMFSKSNYFSSSKEFDRSDFFSKSSMFSKSNKFSNSDRFTKIDLFTQSEYFNDLSTVQKTGTLSYDISEPEIESSSSFEEDIKHFSTFSLDSIFSSDSQIESATQKVTTKPTFHTDLAPIITSKMSNTKIDDEPKDGLKTGNKSSMGVIIGVVVGIIVLIAIIIIVVIFLIRRKKRDNQYNEDGGIDNQSEEIKGSGSSISEVNNAFNNPLYEMPIISNDPFDQTFEES